MASRASLSRHLIACLRYRLSVSGWSRSYKITVNKWWCKINGQTYLLKKLCYARTPLGFGIRGYQALPIALRRDDLPKL